VEIIQTIEVTKIEDQTIMYICKRKKEKKKERTEITIDGLPILKF
jgi:hypothetical protein